MTFNFKFVLIFLMGYSLGMYSCSLLWEHEIKKVRQIEIDLEAAK